MAQDYKIKEYNVSEFQDPHGNTAVNLAFEGFGEPVTVFVKDTSSLSVGKVLYGNIKQVESKNGKTYNRFYREKKEDYQGSQNSSQGKREYTPRDDSAIQAQWAIGQANQLCSMQSIYDLEEVEKVANEFYSMINRVKNGKSVKQTFAKDDEEPEEIKSREELAKELEGIPF